MVLQISRMFMNWELGIDIYTLICITWITNKNLLYKKINKILKLKKISRMFRHGPNVLWTFWIGPNVLDRSLRIKLKVLSVYLNVVGLAE